MLMIIGLAALVLIVIGAAGLLRSADEGPEVGTEAPEFMLNSQDQESVSLNGYRGKWVVLYFYPKDFTSGCTVEAHNFQRDLTEYESRNAAILGVSTQDEKTHQAFCTKEGLNFRLLADTKGEVSKKYGSVVNLVITKLSSRHTFLIDPQGLICKVWTTVNVGTHSREVLDALDASQKAGAS